jgi:hypothetical protein
MSVDPTGHAAERRLGPDGWPLCFECGRPKINHPGGIECARTHEYESPAAASVSVGQPDEREWLLRWDYRQQKHYIDGPKHGVFEGITVVPESSRIAVEEQLREAQRERDEAVKKLRAGGTRRTSRQRVKRKGAEARAEQAERQLGKARELIAGVIATWNDQLRPDGQYMALHAWLSTHQGGTDGR